MQETKSYDRLIDKLYNRGYPLDEIKQIVNLCFDNKVSHNYIENRITVTVPHYKEKLRVLLTDIGIEQRTENWYSARKTLITASDYAQALGEGKFGTQKQFYQKKCGYEESKFDPYVPPLKWGCMFESVAQDIYSHRNSFEIHEFGLLRHKTIDYLGASPDGITSEGVMLEIKCPYKRKITGEIPSQYYYQIQGQLDVCNLDECDYLECAFEVVDNSQQFWDEYDNYQYEQGIIIENTVDNNPVYEYSNIECSKEELYEWESKKYSPLVNTTIHRWRLKQYNVVRVYKDLDFIKSTNEKLNIVWDNILRYRSDKPTYDRETSTTRIRKSYNNDDEVFSFRT